MKFGIGIGMIMAGAAMLFGALGIREIAKHKKKEREARIRMTKELIERNSGKVYESSFNGITYEVR